MVALVVTPMLLLRKELERKMENDEEREGSWSRMISDLYVV